MPSTDSESITLSAGYPHQRLRIPSSVPRPRLDRWRAGRPTLLSSGPTHVTVDTSLTRAEKCDTLGQNETLVSPSTALISSPPLAAPKTRDTVGQSGTFDDMPPLNSEFPRRSVSRRCLPEPYTCRSPPKDVTQWDKTGHPTPPSRAVSLPGHLRTPHRTPLEPPEMGDICVENETSADASTPNIHYSFSPCP